VPISRPTVRQHYVPACYLARFTLGGQRDSRFFIHPVDGSAVREDIPDHVGFERHYHTIDIPGFPPDHLEYVLQEIEAPACALFRTLAGNPGRPFMTEEELATAAEFLSLQAARVPQSQRRYDNLIVEEGRAFENKLAYSPAFFRDVVTRAIASGAVDSSVNQESLREAIESEGIEVVADRTHVAVGMFRLADGIVDAIDGMHQTLWYSNEPDWFVCSDYPVGLFYSMSGDALNPTVRLLADTIFMPLAYNACWVLHRLADVPLVQLATQQMVAVANSIIVSHSERFICSPTIDFVCSLPDSRIGNAQETIETLRALRRR
jgi:hypothetical protein